MSLVLAAILVSSVIAVCCALPWVFPGIRAYSRPLLLVGSVVLLGFVVFDLVPEVVEVGGKITLVLILISSFGFTVLHRLAHRHGHADVDEETPSHGVSVLLTSMALHCFAGGMLLVDSYALSERLALSVFMSLIGHKAFEAISVASLLMRRVPNTSRLFQCAAFYVLSFPAGVVLTEVARRSFAQSLTPEHFRAAALVLTSVAVGSLFGCLIQDFLLPTMREFRYPACKGHTH